LRPMLHSDCHFGRVQWRKKRCVSPAVVSNQDRRHRFRLMQIVFKTKGRDARNPGVMLIAPADNDRRSVGTFGRRFDKLWRDRTQQPSRFLPSFCGGKRAARRSGGSWVWIFVSCVSMMLVSSAFCVFRQWSRREGRKYGNAELKMDFGSTP